MRFIPMFVLLTTGLAVVGQTAAIAQLSTDPVGVYADQGKEKGQQGENGGAGGEAADCD